MMKSDAEHFVRRAMEETGAEFTEEQIQALVYMFLKITGRMLEEAVYNIKPAKRGGGSRFFAD